MSTMDRIEYQAMFRERLGHGGGEYGAQEAGRPASGRRAGDPGADGSSRGLDIGAR